MKNIDAILFDLGGVIINLDWTRTTNAFLNLVPPAARGERAARALAEIFGNRALHEYERAEISWDEFRARLAADIGIAASEEDFLAAWNAMILDIPSTRLQMLDVLRGKYRLGILSNTNERHVDYVNRYLQDTHGHESLDTLVHVPLYSHTVRMRKPEPRIYHHAARALGIPPNRILFIDDVKANADAAAAAGLVGYHLDLERETVLEALRPLYDPSFEA